MNKIVVFSGGYDSLCLLHDVMEEKNNEDNVTLLFFNYGQKNYVKEKEMSVKASNKFNIELKEITIPPFSWSNSSLVSDCEDINNQYIPMRNVIFISYALSMAEATNTSEIYLGFINPGEDEEGNEVPYYPDTSPEFVTWLNQFSINHGITVLTPFINYTKEELTNYIRSYKITREDFFSCNTPLMDEEGNIVPCNQCTDCVGINDMFEEASLYKDIDILIDNDFRYKDEDVKEQLYSLDFPVTSAKLMINNVCNARCEHCFLDSSKMPESDLDIFDVIDTLVQNGITFIDFFGKEPMVDEKLFTYTKYLREHYPEVDYATITNGLNLAKYTDLIIKEFNGRTVTISLEDFGSASSRPVPKNLEHTISNLVENGVDIEISLDLLQANKYEVVPIIKKLDKLGVSSIYVKPIFKIGVTEEKNFVEPIDLVASLIELSRLNEFTGCNIVMELKQPHIDQIRLGFPILYKELTDTISEEMDYYFRGMYLDLEFYCGRYQSVLINNYGNVLGCGFELSLDLFSQNMMGNYKNLKEVVAKGKKKHYYLKNNKKNSCYFA